MIWDNGRWVCLQVAVVKECLSQGVLPLALAALCWKGGRQVVKYAGGAPLGGERSKPWEVPCQLFFLPTISRDYLGACISNILTS